MCEQRRWTIKVITISRFTGRRGWQLARRGKGHPVLRWTDRQTAIAEARRAYGYDHGCAVVVPEVVRS